MPKSGVALRFPPHSKKAAEKYATCANRNISFAWVALKSEWTTGSNGRNVGRVTGIGSCEIRETAYELPAVRS